jgi:folylpolyglutamate synthase/dihydropteroate synthase
MLFARLAASASSRACASSEVRAETSSSRWFRERHTKRPGRFNLLSYRGATLIADYGHNPDAINALVSAIDNMPAKRRSVVISGAGDRRDEDIRQQTEIIGEFLAIDTALGTGHWALGTGHWALGTGHWALGTGHWAHCNPAICA